MRKPAPASAAAVSSYDVALSFAGEDRAYVDEVAKGLKAANVEVFYDDFEKAKLWGKNLIEHLADIYQHKSRYVVMFISQHYVSKASDQHGCASLVSLRLDAIEMREICLRDPDLLIVVMTTIKLCVARQADRRFAFGRSGQPPARLWVNGGRGGPVGVLDRRVLLIVCPTFGPTSVENVGPQIGLAFFLEGWAY
jgi:hypothetical protein